MDYSIMIEKMDRDHLKTVLRGLGEPIAKEVGQMAAILAKRFTKDAGSDGELMRCDACGGHSPESYESCPFCGIAGVVEDAKAEPPPDSEPDEVEEDDADADEDEDEEEDEDVDEDVEPPVAASDPVPEPLPVVTPPAAAKITRTKISKTTAIVSDARAGLLTVADLDRMTAEVLVLKASASVEMWKLGAKIGEIQNLFLWKQRQKEDGKPTYKSFEAYCVAELNMTDANAYELINLAKHYDEARVRTFGRERLVLLLRAPEVAQAEIMTQIEGGASVRDVRAAVANAKEIRGLLGTKRVTGRQVTPVGKPPPQKPKKDKITVAIAAGRRAFRFVTKATMKDTEPKHAKRIGDEPVAKLELTNNVTLYFALSQDNEGCIVCAMTPKRDEP
jgi:hypothetical protein